MDLDTEIKADREALGRIGAMLVALAALAECVSGLPRPVRCLVLWILRPAEAIARNFLVAVTQGPQETAGSIPALGNGHSPADAMRLALNLRAMAAAFDDLRRRLHRFATLNDRLHRALVWSGNRDIWRARRFGKLDLAHVNSIAECALASPQPTPDTS